MWSLQSMAIQELRPMVNSRLTDILRRQCILGRRHASTAEASASHQFNHDVNELEPSSSFDRPLAPGVTFDPALQAQKRTVRLPSSRYKFRPPKYYRGPLHPHQPPPASDPASREFQPGPFTLPRLAQTYETTIAPDFVTLAYQHYPPGYVAPIKAPRLRTWDDSSPYHAGRGQRGPRGGNSLRLLRKPITFRNVPRLDSIVVHSFIREATKDSAPLHVAGMVLQAITGVRAIPHVAKENIVNWNLREGKYVSVTSEVTGEYMHHFMGKLVDVVLPKIKDWKGVRGTSGDTSGNISFGLVPEEVGYFPEVESNYDSYPPKMIPGCHITIKTTATDDRDARLLLTALGIPFYGKQVN